MGIPKGIAAGIPIGIPAGIPAGLPMGIPMGIPVGIPMGVPPPVQAYTGWFGGVQVQQMMGPAQEWEKIPYYFKLPELALPALPQL